MQGLDLMLTVDSAQLFCLPRHANDLYIRDPEVVRICGGGKRLAQPRGQTGK
jgi:hypothetical protein